MALYPNSLEAVLASIKAQNKVTLVPEEYVFGQPEVIETTPTGINTRMTIKAKDSLSTYDGETAITYRRLDLAQLATLVNLDIRGHNLSTVLDIAKLLNTLYGLNLTDDDIMGGSNSAGLTDGRGSVTLEAKSTSRGWIGKVTVNVTPGRYPLKDYVAKTVLPGLYYPNSDETRPFAEFYSYWRDFSAQATALLTMTTSTVASDSLAQILKGVTGDPWVASGKARYSLAGATLAYLGTTEEAPNANSDRYTHVLIVNLVKENCLGLNGQLYIHFDEPDGF